MITAQYSSTILIFSMSTSVVKLFLLALISIVTTDGVTGSINGNVVEPGQFPFLASIRIRDVHVCGGSIINPQFILTAGHCVREANLVNIKDVTVVTGSVKLSEGGFKSNVTKMVNAAGDGEDPDTDIGLIKLTVPLDYDSNTASISYSSSINDLPNDEYGTVIGWGNSNGDTTAKDQLQFIYAYISDMSCTAFTKKKHVICTNNGPLIGVCYGDSGSPLIYNGKIIGVVSRAVLCAKGLPDVYSSTAHNIYFIRYTINSA